MSRTGKKPIKIKEGVNVKFEDREVKVSGPKGELTFKVHKRFDVQVGEDEVIITPQVENPRTRRMHGMIRTNVANMIEGVTEGFSKELQFKGTGYRAKVEGEKLVLNMGYSHPIEKEIPKGIEVKVEKSFITITGFDKQKVGQFAAEVRSVRRPEPYKGKGIKYVDEIIKKKAGKAAAK